MTALLLIGAALAGGQHTGIPVRGVQGLGEPSFQGVDAGWSAGVEGGGFVRVFVGHDEGEATRWLRLGAPLSAGTPPAYPYADEALGDGQEFLAFRDGNVAALVRVPAHALQVADRLRAAIVDGGPAWPSAPTLLDEGGRLRLSVPDPAGVVYQGGRLAGGPGWVFTAPPTELVVWDAWGRPAVLRGD